MAVGVSHFVVRTPYLPRVKEVPVGFPFVFSELPPVNIPTVAPPKKFLHLWGGERSFAGISC